jgi:polyisoprenoid-binding protein YceI
MGGKVRWLVVAAGLSLGLSCARAGAACELPPARDPAKATALYRVVTGPSWVRFDAKAFLHNFAGQTAQIEGIIRVGDANRLSDAEACVQIDAASLDTGNSTRDSIMRNDHLETARFPTIDFLLKAAEAVTHQDGSWQFTASGTLSLHGVRREIQFPVQARQEGDALLLRGKLPVKMTDYGVRIPRFLFLTVEDGVMVSFDVTAKRAP